MMVVLLLLAMLAVVMGVIAPLEWQHGPARHAAYARYLLRHKWFVLRACRTTGAGLWRGLVHDLSKLRPDEWFPYARCFYEPDGTSRYKPDEAFDIAWLNHQHRNRHHWQYWVLREDSGKVLALPMPEIFMREMVADWIGEGAAMGKTDTYEWYQNNRDRIILHPNSRCFVERLLRYLEER